MGERSILTEADKPIKEDELVKVLLYLLYENRIEELSSACIRLNGYTFGAGYAALFEALKAAGNAPDGEEKNAFLEHGKRIANKDDASLFENFIAYRKPNCAAGCATLEQWYDNDLGQMLEPFLDFKKRQRAAEHADSLAARLRRGELTAQEAFPDKFHSTKYRAIPALEFCEKYQEEPQKLFSWGRRGDYALIHAPTGIGKTWFALSHAVALATGKGRACGIWEPCCEPQRVICLDGEMAGYDMRSRLYMLAEMHGTTMEEISERLSILSWRDYDIHLPNPDLESYLAWECRTNKVAMIVLDNYGSIFPVDDENSAGEFESKIFPVIQNLCRHDALVPLIHHSRKGTGDNEDPTYAGSSALPRHATVNIALRKPKKNAAKYGDFEIVFQKDRNAIGIDGRATVDHDEYGRFCWTNGSNSMTKADMIREGLQAYPDMTPKELADKLGLTNDKQIYAIMRAAEKKAGKKC